MPTKMSQRPGVRTVTLVDKDHRENRVVLVRDGNGCLHMECSGRHNGVEVYTAFRLGQMWELLPRIAELA